MYIYVPCAGKAMEVPDKSEDKAKKSPFSPTRDVAGRSPRRRRRRSDSRSEEPGSKRKRRKSPSRHRRRAASPTGQEAEKKKKKRNEESPKAPEAVRSRKDAAETAAETEGEARARSSHDADEEKPPCEHCGKPLTKHESGRAQHKWTSIWCLQHQFWNTMSEKSQKQSGSWEKALSLAKKLRNERMHADGGQAPHRREPVPPPPQPPSPPRRPRHEPRHRGLRLKERSPEFETVVVEPEPVRPASSGVSRYARPAEPPSPPRAASVPASVTSAAPSVTAVAPSVPPVAPSLTQEVQPTVSDKAAPKQLTINITL